MTRKPIIFGNWKMNKTPSEAKEFFEGIKGYVTGDEAAEYGIGAPYVDLAIAVENAGAIKVAAENCNELDSGAYTGEVSVPMLKEVGITYCIIVTLKEENTMLKLLHIVQLRLRDYLLLILHLFFV